MKLIYITIAVILIGLWIGYVSADYYDGRWMEYYYLWDKGKDVLLLLIPVQFVSKKLKIILCSMVVFFLVRFVWQMFAIRDYATASRPSIIFLLYILEMIMVLGIILWELGIPLLTSLKLFLKKWQN